MGPFWLPQSGSIVRGCAIALFACVLAAPASAQTIDVTPAHVAAVDGSASLERDGQIESVNGGMPLVPGDRLRTEAGRVEILFPDGSALDVDEFTSVDLMSATLIRVTSGRVLISVYGAGNPSSAVRYQVDTPAASAATDGPGEYRISLFNAPSLQTELAVTRGFAALSNESGTTPLRAGERALADEGRAPTPPQLFNSARFDAFDQWVATRRGDRTGVATSSQYLPNDLRVYSNDFDRYGSWGYDASYGNVWYPAVTVGWRPYYNGYWSSVRPYGWTWVGYDRWAWPTHHYGRWGFHGNRWFWVPGRQWAPAYVSWGVAPGYVSWCPLGFNNQPVFALSVGFGNFWTGWTAVPRSQFARHHVSQWAVAPDRLGAASFARAAAPPVPVPAMRRAVPRVVANGSRAGAVVPPSFDNRPQLQPRAQIRPRNPQSAGGSGSGQAVVTSPFPSRNPNAVAVPRSPEQGNARTGGWVVPRQQPVVAPPGNTGADNFQRQPGIAPITRQPGRQPVVRPEAQQPLGSGGQQIVRPRNPYMPSITNPYGRQTDGDATRSSSQWNSPAAAAPQNPQRAVNAPTWNGRQNSNNEGARQGSAVPRNQTNGGGQQQSDAGGQQQGNAGGQAANGGGAQAGASRQGGGGGARQRHP
jgi:uncharacterized protein DUF6600/FecR-like protein